MCVKNYAVQLFGWSRDVFHRNRQRCVTKRAYCGVQVAPTQSAGANGSAIRGLLREAVGVVVVEIATMAADPAAVNQIDIGVKRLPQEVSIFGKFAIDIVSFD